MVSDIPIRLPHPVDYFFQKLIIAGQRKKLDKAEKDRQSALSVLEAIIDNGELSEFHKAIRYLSKKELKIVTEELRRAGRESILA